jgi:hypothetical protein
MASFIRSIPQSENSKYIETILARRNHHIPLNICPKETEPGDFIYVAYGGAIIARAKIVEIALCESDVPISSDQVPYDAKVLVRYEDGWRRAPRHIPFKGTTGIRYVNRQRPPLNGLDNETW